MGERGPQGRPPARRGRRARPRRRAREGAIGPRAPASAVDRGGLGLRRRGDRRPRARRRARRPVAPASRRRTRAGHHRPAPLTDVARSPTRPSPPTSSKRSPARSGAPRPERWPTASPRRHAPTSATATPKRCASPGSWSTRCPSPPQPGSCTASSVTGWAVGARPSGISRRRASSSGGDPSQVPVLMDCHRAMGHHRRVEALWDELRAASPSADVLVEGRLVLAEDLADVGKLDEAILVLATAGGGPQPPQPRRPPPPPVVRPGRPLRAGRRRAPGPGALRPRGVGRPRAGRRRPSACSRWARPGAAPTTGSRRRSSLASTPCPRRPLRREGRASSTSAATPSPAPRPRCAGPWPRPRWATTATGTTPPSTSSRRPTRSAWASPPPCTSRRGPWRTRWRCACCARRASSPSPVGANTSSSTRPAAAAANAGVQIHAVDDTDGTISAADVAWAHRGGVAPPPRPRASCAWSTPTCPRAACPGASTPSRPSSPRPRGLPVHMDGARLFNAEVATGVDAAPLRGAGHDRDVVSLQGPVRAGGLGPGRPRRRHGRRRASSGCAWGEHAPGRGHRRGRARGPAHHGRAPGRGPRPGPPPGPGGGRPLARRRAATRTRIPTNMVDLHPPLAPSVSSTTSDARASWPGPSLPGVLRLVTHHDVDDAGLERAVKALASAP